jgi:hypothetical protein
MLIVQSIHSEKDKGSGAIGERLFFELSTDNDPFLVAALRGDVRLNMPQESLLPHAQAQISGHRCLSQLGESRTLLRRISSSFDGPTPIPSVIRPRVHFSLALKWQSVRVRSSVTVNARGRASHDQRTRRAVNFIRDSDHVYSPRPFLETCVKELRGFSAQINIEIVARETVFNCDSGCYSGIVIDGRCWRSDAVATL